MAQIKSIPIADIAVPARLRAVSEDYALAIQTSIVQHGLLNPITVRHTPAAKGPKYQLVAGAHRRRAMELLEEPEIECIVVEADKLDAVLIEIEENLFRNDLSKLDRTVTVAAYREIWEEKHGEIRRGGDQRANFALCPDSPLDLIGQEASQGYSVWCAERLGLSIRAVKYATQIAKNLPADLRARLRGTTAEDNQSILLRFAGLPPEKRAKAAQAIDLSQGDIAAALELLEGQKPKQDEGQVLVTRFVDTFGRAPAKSKRDMLAAIGIPDDLIKTIISSWSRNQKAEQGDK